MKTNGNTVLITGGATGIGFALAQKLSKLGNKVIICGRREHKLNEAREKLPGLHTIRCDISNAADRKKLLEKISSDFSDINLLVNNAGIQRNIDFTKGLEDLEKNEDEIDINFKAQVYLSASIIPLMKRKDSAIINISSGLGFVPLASFPMYSATKAAMHSFSLSLRHQLKQKGIRVFEVVPPTVYDTELKGKPIEKAEWMSSSAEVADAVVEGIEADRYEIGIGASKPWITASREDLDKAFGNINH
ncbi:MAG: SDR family NAD(P)-dependent oxidoreductase [Candidatus Marsarchaeota archaeon]|nr:SDR family NAD(P)-dependent oxidoreductase [Candidatus Marsarchaeota archaeon]